MDRNAIQHLLLCVGMTPNEILHESEYFPVSQSEVGVRLLLHVFADLVVVIQLFCVSVSRTLVGLISLPSSLKILQSCVHSFDRSRNQNCFKHKAFFSIAVSVNMYFQASWFTLMNFFF